ncbi:MAG: OmpH family outer membrane protein, partial [Planctomycetales bacterium]|nr:OmpH family outer membrane protein [Planctomycetales bacterium]
AKLRSWSKLKIDTSSVPEKLRGKYQLRIQWRNNFAGALPSDILHIIRANSDPFGSPGSSVAPLDWRFHDYVTRSQVVDIVDQTITVPPGEVTIVLNKLGSDSSASPSMPSVILGIVRTASDQTAEFALPKFGSAQGQLLVPEASFPNWGQTIIDQATLINALPVRGDGSPFLSNPAQRLAGLSRSQDSISDPFAAGGVAHQNRAADAVAGYYASAEGTAERALIAGNAMVPTNEQGQFTFDFLPIGQYELRIQFPTGTQNSSVEYGTSERLTAVGSDTPGAFRFVINPDELTDLGNVSRHLNQREVIPKKPSGRVDVKPSANQPQVGLLYSTTSNPFATTANARIETALNSPVEDINFHTTPFAQVIDSLSSEVNIPILLDLPKLEELGYEIDTPVTLSLPSATLRSALNLVLAQVSSSRDPFAPKSRLTLVIRDEGILVTTGKDAASDPNIIYSETQTFRSSADSATPSPTRDRAAEIVKSWLKSAPENAERSELQQLLETQLSAEFDSQQQTRRTEIDRLQQLLEQSRSWLDQRRQQREQIIQRRVQELLDKAD